MKVNIPTDQRERITRAYHLALELDVLLNALPYPPYPNDEEISKPVGKYARP